MYYTFTLQFQTQNGKLQAKSNTTALDTTQSTAMYAVYFLSSQQWSAITSTSHCMNTDQFTSHLITPDRNITFCNHESPT